MPLIRGNRLSTNLGAKKHKNSDRIKNKAVNRNNSEQDLLKELLNRMQNLENQLANQTSRPADPPRQTAWVNRQTAPPNREAGRRGAPPPAVRPSTTMQRSTNTDFATMVKTLFRGVQLRHHKNNWAELPASIEKNLTTVGDNITPADPTPEVRNMISAIMIDAGERIQRAVIDHLNERIEANRSTLKTLHPADKLKAKTIAFNQLKKRLGKKSEEKTLERLLNEEFLHLREDRTYTTVTDRRNGKHRLVGNSPTPVRNQFEILNDELDELRDSELEDDMPAPPSPHPPPPLPSAPGNRKKKLNRVLNKADWSVDIHQNIETLVISDSTLQAVDEKEIPANWQLAIFPGAKIRHISSVLAKLPRKYSRNLVIQAGINNRHNPFDAGTAAELGELEQSLSTRNERIFTSHIYHGEIDEAEADNVARINGHLRLMTSDNHIEFLLSRDLRMAADQIHFDKATADALFNNMTNVVRGHSSKN
jgi:hypothetical protein